MRGGCNEGGTVILCVIQLHEYILLGLFKKGNIVDMLMLSRATVEGNEVFP